MLGFSTCADPTPLSSPSTAERCTFIERRSRSLAGAGAGWADVQILLTAAKAGARLHTADKAVRKLCRTLVIRLA